MRTSTLYTLVAAACALGSSAKTPRDYNSFDYYALHLDSDISPKDLAAQLGLQHEGPLANLEDHHVFRAAKGHQDLVQDARDELKQSRLAKRDLEPHILDGILLNQKQQARRRLFKRDAPPSLSIRTSQQSTAAVDERNTIAKSLDIRDPIFDDQWHIFNTDQVGHDLNVTGVWLQGITGKNATVCIIDDGLDFNSLDLAPNYYAAGSWDYNTHGPDPLPQLADDQHGTRCAGEVAAARNNVCGVGVAYDARIAGVRILSAPISDIDEAESLMYGYQNGNDIYSCSWGPPDDGATMEAPGVLVRRAISKAVQQGRGGKGSIYVFAAGNGAAAGDNCNFDGYTNSIDSITVGAIDKTDSHPYYSEKCSAQLVVTYSSGAGDSIHTTDVGRDKCTSNHGGTSAAGPLASGVYALVLSVRPDLSWRDLQWLTVMAAVPIDADPDSWQNTATGRRYSHQYGYGKLDAYAIVEAAKDWKNVDKQAWYFGPVVHVNSLIPQVLSGSHTRGLDTKYEVTSDMLANANINRLEHVTVTMNIEHDRRGDIAVDLISPFGTVSHLATPRRNDNHPDGYKNWTFMSVVHFGESGVGDWHLIVNDNNPDDNTGTLIDWRLNLYGEASDGTNQPLLPLPSDTVDDDFPGKVTDLPSTTIIPMPTSSISSIDGSGHPTRPAIAKPTADKGDETGQTSGSADAPTATDGVANPGDPGSLHQPGDEDGGGSSGGGGGTDDNDADHSDDASSPVDGSSDADSGSIIPSFPSFGVSKRTQLWIYGALGLIAAFCLGLACYFCIVRRRKVRNARDDYAFEMVGDDDDLPVPGAPSSLRRTRGRRAGELYDAFAGESDEEGLLSDDEEAGHGPYRDREEGYRDHERDDDVGGGGETGRR